MFSLHVCMQDTLRIVYSVVGYLATLGSIYDVVAILDDLILLHMKMVLISSRCLAVHHTQ